MDLNVVVLSGRLAAPAELRVFDSGTRLARFLVSVRSDEPRRRVDVIPVSFWDPSPELLDEAPEPGRAMWVAGTVQRRFWQANDGRRSRVEVVAHDVQFRDPDLEQESDSG